MQMTTEARTWLDATVRRILARHPLGDPERAGITYELMSHLHASGEAHAIAQGHTEVSRQDLEAALAEAGGEDGLAAAFVEPLSKPVVRVLFWRRVGAFAIDAVLLLLVLGLVHGAVAAAFHPLLGHAPVGPKNDSLWGLFPWGFHDSTAPAALQALIAVASGAVVLGYFTWIEAHEGRSLGKRAFGLRVMRVDGQPMTYRESLLRNLAKLQPFVLIVDTLIMLLAFRNERQRVSDRIAGTVVVRA